jgi:hypothetical protein
VTAASGWRPFAWLRRRLGGGATAAPSPEDPFRVLEALTDRIAAAIAIGAEPAARESWRGDAKAPYYLLLAARDLLRGQDATREVRALIDRAAGAEGRIASELAALGAAGERLRRELAAALGACRSKILRRLPPAPPRQEVNHPRVTAIATDGCAFPCAACGEPAVLVRRYVDPEQRPGDEPRTGVLFRGITRRNLLAYRDEARMAEILGWAKTGDFARLHAYMLEAEDVEGGLDAYCPACDRIYCRTDYQVREEWDQGFYDCSYGVCPEGHRRLIDD